MCLLVYGAVQQSYRESANDPQIQMSEDLANSLKNGGQVPTFASSKDVSATLSTFVMVFNKKGELATSEAVLDGKPPVVPNGVFDFIKTGLYKPSILRPKSFFYNLSQTQGENRFTWEPKEGVRIATVLTYYKGEKNSGYVLAGRSLREVEIREEKLEHHVAFAWIFTMAVSFIATMIFLPTSSKK